jgi:hypothetical protein
MLALAQIHVLPRRTAAGGRAIQNWAHAIIGLAMLGLGYAAVWTGFGEFEIWSGLGPVSRGWKAGWGVLLGVRDEPSFCGTRRPRADPSVLPCRFSSSPTASASSSLSGRTASSRLCSRRPVARPTARPSRSASHSPGRVPSGATRRSRSTPTPGHGRPGGRRATAVMSATSARRARATR